MKIPDWAHGVRFYQHRDKDHSTVAVDMPLAEVKDFKDGLLCVDDFVDITDRHDCQLLVREFLKDADGKLRRYVLAKRILRSRGDPYGDWHAVVIPE